MGESFQRDRGLQAECQWLISAGGGQCVCKIDLQVRGGKCWDHVGLGGDSTGTANVTRIWGRGVCYDIVCMVFVDTLLVSAERQRLSHQPKKT
jgi:hypothetical protein